MQNQLEISYLNITQLLELKTPEGFEIITPQINVDTNAVITGNVDEIFADRTGNRPEIKSSELKLTASEYDLKIAKGGRSPRLYYESFIQYRLFRYQQNIPSNPLENLSTI